MTETTRRVLLPAALLGASAVGALLAGEAKADTAFTSFAFNSTGGSNPRTDPERWADVTNVLDFGADNAGNSGTATATTTAINNAIAAAAARGVGTGTLTNRGQVVYFPPGNYMVNGSLVNTAANTSVRLVGASMYETKITGLAIAGFTIDQNSNNRAIQSIEDLTVTNNNSSTGNDITTGAIRFNNVQNGLIKNVSFTGWSGIVSYNNTFENSFINVSSSGPALGMYSATPILLGSAGPIGFYVSGCTLLCCAALGYCTAMWIGPTTDTALLRCRTESSNFGIVSGIDVLTNLANGVSAIIIQGHSTERCDTAMYLNSLGAATVNGCVCTGVMGTGKPITQTTSGIVWSAGVATLTTPLSLSAWFNWTTGQTRQVMITDTTGSLGSFDAGVGPTGVTATWVSDNSFSYPLAANPGTFTIPQPNTNNAWVFPIQYGIRFRGGTNVVFNGVGVSAQAAKAGIDLFVLGNQFGSGLTFTSCSAGIGGWIMPLASAKAGYQYINCDQPTGSTLDASGLAAGMLFTNLPGAGSATVTTAKEGMEYDITNGAKFGGGSLAALGDQVVGGGTQHAHVRYNGTIWTVMGL